MKKIISLLLCMVALSLALSGCGERPVVTPGPVSSETASKEETLEPIEYSVFLSHTKVPDPDNKFLKYIREKYGITFRFETTAGDIKTRVGLMIASGDYPDVLSPGDEVETLIEAGAFMPLEDLIEEHAPGLKERHYGDLWKRFHTKDGHVYIWPTDTYHGEYTLNEQNNGAYWVQKAVLKEFNYPWIKTIDEFFGILKQYKDKYPEINGQKTIPVVILTHEWRRFCLINGPVNLAGYPNNGEWIVDPKVPGADSYKIDIAQNKDITKRYLQIYNKAYNDGLIDPESFTMTYDQYIAKISTGTVLGFYDHKWQFRSAERALIQAGMPERTYVPFPVTFDEDIVDRYTEQPVVPVSVGTGLSIKCKEPVRFLKFMEEMATDEFQKIIFWGFEGEDYYVDENGRFRMTPEQKARKEAADAYKYNCEAFSFIRWYGTRPDGNSYRHANQPELFQESLSEFDLEILKAYNKRNFYEFLTPPPPNPVYGQIWDAQLPQDASNAAARLQDVTYEYFVKAITAKPEDFESVWDEFQKKIENIDYKLALDALQAELDRRMEMWK